VADIVKRYKKNPIITKENVPFECDAVYNTAAAKFNDKYILLFRALRPNGRCVLGLAESKDGYDFNIHEKPVMEPADFEPFRTYEEYGIEDPRITQIKDTYYIFYSAYSQYGVRIGLAQTKDFCEFQRISLVTQADYRNAVLFPKKINGLYVRLDRPNSEICPWSIWMSYSPDLKYWGESKIVMMSPKYHWDEMKIGPGAPPIETKRGWLNIYHGVFPTMDGAVYRLGCALHELNEPSKIIGVSDRYILSPEKPYERVGYVHNVVFTCGAIAEDNGEVKIYYGGADQCICVGTAKISELVDLCINNSRKAM